jgi:hypothetical protein
MRRFWLVSLALVLTGGVGAQTPGPGTGSVTGHVECADTHTPFRFAMVTLQTVQTIAHAKTVGPDKLTESDWKDLQSKSYSVATGIDGRFVISGVNPGDYYIYAESTGYLDPYRLAITGALGDASQSLDALEKLLPRVRIAAGKMVNSELTLVRGASMEGSVRFDDGGYAYLISVTLYRKDNSGKWNPYGDKYIFGHRVSPPHVTDDRGRFSIDGLVPGSYIVKAVLPEAHVLDGVGVGVAFGGVESLAVFNGDKFRLKEAPPIELAEGEERTGIDIHIPVDGLHVLQGSVNAKPDGRTITKGTVSLVDPDDQTVMRETEIQLDGSFVFDLVVSGMYQVRVTAKADDSSSQPATRYQALTTTLEVAGDLSDLTYTVLPAK